MVKTEDQNFTDKPDIAREILAYLVDHPEADDTLDGIAQWWLLERKIYYHLIKVQEALNELVVRGYLIRNAGRGKGISYQVDKNRLEEITSVIKMDLRSQFGSDTAKSSLGY
jgi:hypothetical protein